MKTSINKEYCDKNNENSKMHAKNLIKIFLKMKEKGEEKRT